MSSASGPFASDSDSRLIEMLDASLSREKIPSNTEIGPDSPPIIRETIAAVFSVKLGLYVQYLPREARADLQEDLFFVLLALLGRERLQSQGFRSLYDAAAKDLTDAVKRQWKGQA